MSFKTTYLAVRIRFEVEQVSMVAKKLSLIHLLFVKALIFPTRNLHLYFITAQSQMRTANINRGDCMATPKDRVIEACESNWETWKSDCSGFLKAVAGSLGIELKGQANDIIDAVVNSPSWSNLGNDHALATTKASQGLFVIGGTKTSPNGHVVVVVKSASTGHPVAYWGQLGRTGRKSTTINWSWRPAQISDIQYFSISL